MITSLLRLPLVCLLLAASAGLSSLRAEDYTPEAGFVSLFNGKDLTGWCYSPTDKFDGKNDSSDGPYTGKDGIPTVHPQTPRVLTKLWTEKEFPKDFIL